MRFKIIFVLFLLPTIVSGQNLLQNGGFVKDISGWTVDARSPSSKAVWNRDDVTSDPNSGSLEVSGQTAVFVCVPVASGTTYYFRLYNRSEGSSEGTGMAAQFFSMPACGGSRTGLWNLSGAPPSSDWQAYLGSQAAPAGSSSAAVSMGTSGHMLFDNAYFGTSPAPVPSCNMNCSMSGPLSVRIGEVAPFSLTTIGCTAFRPFTYIWDFGDGTSSTTQNPSATHTYSKAGVYRWTYVAQGNGAQCSASGTITVLYPKRRAVKH